MADTGASITWGKVWHEFLEIGLGTAIGAIGHFLVTEIKGDKRVVTGINVENIRALAPYYVLSLADEAEFNRLMSYLDPGLRKNQEIQMGPIQYGPLLPGQVHTGLGNNQRSDVIKTTVQLNEPNPKLPAGTESRDDTKKMLEQLAEISDPAAWKNRAVAFKLMKENESDYPGARLTEQASAALVAAIAEFSQAKTEWDNWATDESRRVRRWRRRLNIQQRARTRNGLIRWATSFYRVFQLPTE